MEILSFGSLNIDNVYCVEYIVKPGETISSKELKLYPGGKGLNQSVALAKAGVPVYHAGNVGEDGGMLMEYCTEYGVDTRLIRKVKTPTGNAMIQVSDTGENSIVLFRGANFENDIEYIKQVLGNFAAGDYLILQNEINCLKEVIDIASEKEMVIVLNPSPMNHLILDADLKKVTFFIMNEIEGYQITGRIQPEEILDEMLRRYPLSKVVLTLGENGAYYQDGKERIFQEIFKVDPVDTTAAGDTFAGYFIASLVRDIGIKHRPSRFQEWGPLYRFHIRMRFSVRYPVLYDWGVKHPCIDFAGFGYIILQRSIIYWYLIQDRRRQDVRKILFQC